jgi:UDP-N-acetylglucosamine acyltransferase
MYDNCIIDSTAKIANDVVIGPWSTIGPGVELESGVVVGSNVEIKCNTHVGANTAIHSFAAIGGDPQHLGYKGEQTALVIGKNNTIREFATISRGTAEADGVTRIGDNNYIMSYCHVAHDCVVGDKNVFANNASCAGHVTIGNNVVLGAFAGIHQFSNIGDFSFLGRATKTYQDMLPYFIVAGNPGTPVAVNLIGLKRAGFTLEERKIIKYAYKIIFRDFMKLDDVVKELTDLCPSNPVLQPMLDMFANSKRGIARHAHSVHTKIKES